MPESKGNFWKSPLTRSRIKSDDVKLPEMLLGYFIGPFGALLSSGIFTSILQNYFTDVLKLDLGFLTTLQLISTVLIVAANLIVGQLIERTKALAGKARPWILLSALTLSVSSVLMFIVPFEGTAKMVWIAIAYNLYYPCEEGLKYYDNLIDCMIANGLDPMITISHYEMPLNLALKYNGWASRELVDFFVKYCETLFKRYNAATC